MSFTLTWSAEARADLRRLESHLIEIALERGDFDLPDRAMDAIDRSMLLLEINPYACRMLDQRRYERELVIPFGKSGYLAFYQIISGTEVVVGAIRHQREDDYDF